MHIAQVIMNRMAFKQNAVVSQLHLQ